jgi:hypothetical protein
VDLARQPLDDLRVNTIAPLAHQRLTAQFQQYPLMWHLLFLDNQCSTKYIFSSSRAGIVLLFDADCHKKRGRTIDPA